MEILWDFYGNFYGNSIGQMIQVIELFPYEISKYSNALDIFQKFHIYKIFLWNGLFHEF